MVSEIGRPIDQPQIIDVRVEPAEGRHLNTLRRPIQAVVSSQLEAIPQLAAKLLDGDIVLDRWPLARG
jgi:S-adenosylmethionine synthetase